MRWLHAVISAIPFGEDFLCQVTRLGGKGEKGKSLDMKCFPAALWARPQGWRRSTDVSELISERVLVCPPLGPSGKTASFPE